MRRAMLTCLFAPGLVALPACEREVPSNQKGRSAIEPNPAVGPKGNAENPDEKAIPKKGPIGGKDVSGPTVPANPK